jgi:ankyrin repeat protein
MTLAGFFMVICLILSSLADPTYAIGGRIRRIRKMNLKIHDCAARGDVAGIAAELERGAPIDALDDEGRTPLMVAVESAQASAEAVVLLISRGANVNAILVKPPPPEVDAEALKELGIDVCPAKETPPSAPSVLGHAAHHASQEKIDLLLAAGADPTYVDPCGYSILLNALHRDFPESKAERRRLILRLIKAGAPLDIRSAYDESALSVASGVLFDVELIRLLCESGADFSVLRWNDLFFAIAYGDVDQVKTLAQNGCALDDRDLWRRTPFLLAVATGSIEIAELLLAHGASLSERGHCGRTPLIYAIEQNDANMLKWLIARGADVEESDEFGGTPLYLAAQMGAADCVRELLASGADAAIGPYQENAIKAAATPEIVELLVQHGEELSDVDGDMRRKLVGHESAAPADLFDRKLRKYRRRTFGKSNPERMNNDYWDAMVRSRDTAYAARSKPLRLSEFDGQPIWCFHRFGQTITKLPDGRYVEIGGEHEDFYDPDFCIYNDVVVHHGDGSFDIYGYPEDVFPPTDFHTATLLGDYIYIIGCLGYCHRRRPGFTPVYRLNTSTFAIEPVECAGEPPGWVYDHKARRVSNFEIEIAKGKIQDESGESVANDHVFRLDIEARIWRRL